MAIDNSEKVTLETKANAVLTSSNLVTSTRMDGVALSQALFGDVGSEGSILHVGGIQLEESPEVPQVFGGGERNEGGIHFEGDERNEDGIQFKNQ